MLKTLLAFLATISGYQPPTPYWTSTPPNLLVGLHTCRADIPRLFTRGEMIEISTEELIEATGRKLSNPLLRVGYMQGPDQMKAEHDRLAKAYAYASVFYAKWPHQPLTDRDVGEFQLFMISENAHFVVTPWVDDGFAHGDAKVVQIPHVAFTSTGLPDRGCVLHELTHYFQQHVPGHTFAMSFDYDMARTAELAPIVAECAEKIRQGMTAEQWEKLDHQRWAVADALPFDNLYGRVVSPRIRGPLLVQYVKKYGPHFTGNNWDDCEILRKWTTEFETAGTFEFPIIPVALKDCWLGLARYELYSGQISPLFSTCQTWLAVNGCASWYMSVVPEIPRDDLAPEPAAFNLETLTRTKTWQDLPEANRRAALAFLGRCEGRQEE